MRIGINTGSFLADDDDWHEMVTALFHGLAKNNPAHEFVFIAHIIKPPYVIPLPNVSTVVISRPSAHSLGLKLWFDYKLPSFLKKNKVGLLVNFDGVSSLRCKIPQVLLIRDLAFLDQPSRQKKMSFAKKRWRQSLQKASAIVLFNQPDKEKMTAENVFLSDKIQLADLFASPALRPVDWQKRESVQEKYSGAKEYFLFEMQGGAIDPLVLLKAFSLFKKRQQSNMQLLLAGPAGKSAGNFTAKLSTYKYRDEVRILGILPKSELAELLPAAYCVIRFSGYGINLPLLTAMQTGVPAIVLVKNETTEMLAGVALYTAADNTETIAEQMKTIYKDENLRSRMIAAGLEIAKSNTAEKTSAQVWQAISRAIKN